MKTVEDYKNFINKIEKDMIIIVAMIDIIKNSCEIKDLTYEQIYLEIVMEKVDKLFENICDFY